MRRNELTPLPVSVFRNGKLLGTVSVKGTETEWRTVSFDFGAVDEGTVRMELFFALTGVEVRECSIDRQ